MDRIDGVRVRVAGESELGKYCELWNSVWPDHEQSLDEMIRDREVLPPEQQVTVWLAELADFAIGFATAYRHVGEYHPQKWNIAVGTLKERRVQGVGRALYLASQEFIEKQNPISIATRVTDQDPDSLGFANRRGFEESYN